MATRAVLSWDKISVTIEVDMDADESQIGEDLVRLFTFELDGFEWKFNFKLKSGYTWGTF